MNVASIEVPKFHPAQVVRFTGGQGLVRSYLIRDPDDRAIRLRTENL
jgi:hypothetical protein